MSDTDIHVLDFANLTQGRTKKTDPDDSIEEISVSTHSIGQYLTLTTSASSFAG